MKKIEAIIPPSTLNQAIQAIRKVGVGGLTVIHAQGLGSADPPLVGQFFSTCYALQGLYLRLSMLIFRYEKSH
jgi:nitrogen regulatory protein PII